MNQLPHYLLLSKTDCQREHGVWQFLLRSDDGSTCLEASDVEADTLGERLELLCVVRGLEALEQPSRVTLLTCSRYVREGVRHGVNEWRANDWRWERFGKMVSVKHEDLWRRIDRAMQFHTVDCRTWRLDGPHGKATDAETSQRRQPAAGPEKSDDPTHDGELAAAG